MDDRENLPDYESLTRCVRATSQNQFVEFTEKQLLYHLLLYHIIYSGTPENVGPAVSSDLIEMHLGELPNLSVKIV